MFVFACAAILFLAITTTNCYPLRSGTCRAGPSIGTSSGGNHGPDGVGSLEENNFVVTIDGNVVTPDTEVRVAPSMTVSVTVMAEDGASFRGYFNRVGGVDGVDAVDTLTVVNDVDTVALASTGDTIGPLAACAEDVAGISHTIPSDKTSTTVEFTPSGNVGDSYLMDIQLVMANGRETRNQWVWSEYTLVVGQDDVVEETDAPTVTPIVETDAPTAVSVMETDAPISVPVMETDAPTAVPLMETDAPTAVPVTETDPPTAPPVVEETDAPTNPPVETNAPTVEETEAPMATTTMAPSKAPEDPCDDSRVCRYCQGCKLKYETCEEGVKYCAFCEEFCPDDYRGNVVKPESPSEDCVNLRFGRRCRRCRRFEQCEGFGTAYCEFCQDTFPDVYRNEKK